VLQRLGYTCAELDDPYAAAAELARRPLVYRALILSVAGLYREELALVLTVKRRFPHVEVWLTHTDGRHAAMAEALAHGADGLLSDDGLHRTASEAPVVTAPPPPRTLVAPYAASEPDHTAQRTPEPAAPAQRRSAPEPEPALGEPVLTADELRALLMEQPTLTSSGDSA
jgi:hypothetical protein